MKYRIDELRQQALALLREDEALAFVISPAGRSGKEAAQRARERILGASKRELLAYIANVREHIRSRRREFGVKAAPRDLV